MVKTFTPSTLDEALATRSEHKTLIFNGGTDLMVKHRSWNGTIPT
ncbi:MAG: dehydrogenase, partial [Erysipelotrichales bacterium]